MAQLTANDQGVIKGRFTIPPNVPAGSKSVAFTGSGGSHGEAVFVGQGNLTTQTLRQVTNVTRWYYDPLAQTFALEKAVQLAGVDLWFTAKNTEVRVQIREVVSGVPSRTIIAEKILAPDDIVVTGGGHTRVLFPAPVSLDAGAEYALVILCDDPDTRLAIAEMGKFDSTRQQWVTSQAYSVGVLLSSSNASTWTPHQEKDLAFRLLEADFGSDADLCVDMGTVPVTEVTDLLLIALAEIPSAQCRTEYELAFPDGSTQTVAQGQALVLSSPLTGAVGVTARLSGEAGASPVLYPGAQLLTGTVGQTADYYTRSVVATNATRASLIYDAVIPSGASVKPEIQIDGGAWEAMTATGTTTGDDGNVEFRFSTPLSGASLIKVRLTLAGTSQARPVVRNIRLLAVS